MAEECVSLECHKAMEANMDELGEQLEKMTQERDRLIELVEGYEHDIQYPRGHVGCALGTCKVGVRRGTGQIRSDLSPWIKCARCDKPVAYDGAIFCGAACSARSEEKPACCVYKSNVVRTTRYTKCLTHGRVYDMDDE